MQTIKNISFGLESPKIKSNDSLYILFQLSKRVYNFKVEKI
jgi:hypothetical protein